MTSTRRQFSDLKLRLFYSNNVTQAALPYIPTDGTGRSTSDGAQPLSAIQITTAASICRSM